MIARLCQNYFFMYPNTIQTSIPEFIQSTYHLLTKIPEIEWNAKPHPDGWSKKEILGHLIDSAMTNIRRLVVTQYQPNQKILYRQIEWVAFQAYQSADTTELIELWRLINLHYDRVSKNIPVTSMDLTSDTGRDEPSLNTLAFLIEDYWGHQQHHLKAVLGE